MKKIIIIVAILLVLFIAGSYFVSRIFSKRISEKMLEKSFEAASGKNIDVNIDQKENGVEMTWETEEGEVHVSSNGELPKNFPKKIPLYKGYEITGTMTTDNGTSGTVSIKVADDVDAVYSFYEDQFDANDWEISSTYNMEDSKYITARIKDEDLRLSVIISKDDNKEDTVIALSYGPYDWEDD